MSNTNQITIRRGNSANIPSDINFSFSELVWYSDKDSLRMGYGSNKTIDFIYEQNIKNILNIIDYKSDRSFFITNSQNEQIFLFGAKYGDICFRRDIEKAFILKGNSPLLINDWIEVNSLSILNKINFHSSSTLVANTWYRLFYVPYGQTGCKIKISYNSLGKHFFCEFFSLTGINPSIQKQISTSTINQTDSSFLFKEIKLSYDSSSQVNGFNLELLVGGEDIIGGIDVELEEHSEKTKKWVYKNFEETYSSLPDSINVLI
jgi:hypothetical protein